MGNEESPQVSVFVVTYKSTRYIRQCVAGIANAAAESSYEILMIDNGDGDTEAVARAELPQVKIVPSEGNIGFGAGNNRCALHARAPLFMLVNPDAVPQAGAIDRLVALANATPEAAAWGGRSYDPSGNLDNANYLALPTPADFIRFTVSSKSLRRGGLPPSATTLGEVDVLNGGFMMVRADVWHEIGGFDESFFLYSEEVDLFKRIRDRGYAVLVDPDVKVTHDSGSGNALSPRRIMHMTIGRMHYARKHFGASGVMVAGWGMWIAALRYATFGTLMAKLIPGQRERFTKITNAWTPIVRERQRWWYGYRTGNEGHR